MSDQQNNAQNAFNNLNNTPDTTSQFDPADVEKNKTMAVLAYLGFLWLVPMFAAKDSKFARFHVNQGLVLFLVEAVWGVLTGIISGIVPLVGYILSIANIVFLVFVVLGILNAVNGRAKELPLIGKISIIK